MKRYLFFSSFFIYLVIALTFIQVIISNMLSTSGFSLSKLDSELKKYQTENLILSEKVLAKSSLTSIASSAAELGFAKNETQVVYVSDSLPIAKR